MTRGWLTTLYISLNMCGIAAAQTTASPPPPAAANYLDPSGGLTLEEALSQALKLEPGLRSATVDIEVAQGQRAQAALRPNPSVVFAHQQEPGGTDSQTRFEVQWPLDLARRSSRIRAADSAVAASRAAVTARGRELAGLVRQKFGEAAIAIQEVAIDDAALAVALDQQRLVRARVDQGTAPAVERTIIDLDVQQLRAEQVAAVGRAEGTLIELKRLLGLAPDAAVRLKSGLADLARAEDPGQPVAVRADVAAAEAQVTAAESDVARVRAEGRPDVSVTGMYMRMDAGFPQQGFGPLGGLERVRGVFHYLSAGAMVTVPVLNRNQGTIAAAEAARVKATLALEAARATAGAEVASARVRDRQARAALDLLDGARELARQNVTVLQQSYELGRATLLDVLEQQRRFVEIERQFSAALAEAFTARQALVQATGGVQ